MSGVVCQHCRQTVVAALDGPHVRVCPNCGTRLPVILKSLGGAVGIFGGLADLRHGRPGAAGSHGSINGCGILTSKMVGRPPRNEEDADVVAERLRMWLNAADGTWGNLARCPANDAADFFAKDAAGRSLEIQVVRVGRRRRWEALGKAWRKWTHAAVVNEKEDPDSAALEIFHAIGKKAAKYSPEACAKLALAIDTIRLPSHTFPQVIAAFQATHLRACRQFGFLEVWLVGPADQLVFRLDQ